MKGSINRRTFIKQTTAAGIGLGVVGHLTAMRGLAAPSNKLVVAGQRRCKARRYR